MAGILLTQFTAPCTLSKMRQLTTDTDQYVQLLRKDLRSEKKQIVAVNMSLTEAEAQKFWPVYDEYATDSVND